MHQIIEAKALKPYKVWIRFSDGAAGTVDLGGLAGKGVFAAWQDPRAFAQVSVDPESHALRWPGGIDLAPEVLYEDIRKAKV